MKKVVKNLLPVILLSFILVVFNSSLTADQSKTKLVKPDLKVQNLTVNQTGKTKNGGIKVNIRVVIKNNAKFSSKTGLFNLVLKYRDQKTGPYKNLITKPISALNTNPKMLKQAIRTIFIRDTVPAGVTRYYRLNIDPDNKVKELNRNNNMMDAEFRNPNRRILTLNQTMAARRAFPPCEGVDLIVYDVEIIRNDRGQIFLRARIKNLCEGVCNGALELHVDESAQGGAGISVSFGTRIEGEQLSGWSQWLGVYYNEEGGDNSYIVSIQATCTETNTDNSLPVTLEEGVNSKTVRWSDR